MKKLPLVTKFYFGWIIVAVSFAANFLGAGTGFYIFNAFIEPLCSARGWTRAEINVAPMLGYIMNLLGVFIFGTMVHRVGPRILMGICSVFTALSFLLLGFTSDLYVFYALFMLLFFSISGMSGIVTATAVNNWFVLKRGFALGIATAGVSLAGVILPAFALAIIQTRGLMAAFLWISVIVVFMAPVAFALIRTGPEEFGLMPDGVAHEKGALYDDEPFYNGRSSGVAHEKSVWTLPMLIRSQAFWKISIAYGLSMGSVMGVMFQLKPRFTDVGFDHVTAMRLMTSTAMLGVAGKFVWAWLCDRFSARKVVMVLLLFNMTGLFLGIIHGSLIATIMFVTIYGFSMGGVVSTQPVFIASYFGRQEYPMVARYSGLIVGINTLGYAVMGASFYFTGSYDAGYVAFILQNLIALVLIGMIKNFE